MVGRVVIGGLAAVIGCGGDDERVIPLIDAAATIDGGSCGRAACDNCIDDDGDGAIDSADIHCTGGADDDESSFGTGVVDVRLGAQLDCLFDNNTGSGDDGCEVHLCCSLGAADQAECDQRTAGLGVDVSGYDPAVDCAPSARCVEVCELLTPPGCDCFGCCTLCDGDRCFDVQIHERLSGRCDLDTLADSAICTPCAPIAGCSSRCGEVSECERSADCGAREYCASGCCVLVAD